MKCFIFKSWTLVSVSSEFKVIFFIAFYFKNPSSCCFIIAFFFRISIHSSSNSFPISCFIWKNVTSTVNWLLVKISNEFYKMWLSTDGCSVVRLHFSNAFNLKYFYFELNSIFNWITCNFTCAFTFLNVNV